MKFDPSGAAPEESPTPLQTGQSSELSTAGQLDSVIGADGRTLPQPGDQEGQRDSQPARQAAVLDALPAQIALLDANGVIVFVNRAWRQFGAANGVKDLTYGLGTNYLALCGEARGADAAEAGPTAVGIRSVLVGMAKGFSLEYPCHAPTEKRWFLMNVTRLGAEHANGVVVMHIDVTEKRQIEEGLRVSEERFREMAENIRDVFYMRDTEGRMLYVSPAYEDIWGRSCESLYADPDSWSDAVHPDDRAATQERTRSGLLLGSFDFEYRIVRPDHSVRWIESRGFPVRDAAGRIVRVAVVAADITARKRAEVSIQRLNRVYAVLSQINGLILRVLNREELFKEACRIAVEAGGFRMAWVCLADFNLMQLVPAASAVSATLPGSNKILAEFAERMLLQDDAPRGHGPSALAVRERKAILINDIEHDSRIRYKRAYLDRGIRSLVALPLMIGDAAVGVLGLHAPEARFFDEAEMKLLYELAGDIAFAIDNLDKQDRADYVAFYDVLTGLANRRLFLERVAPYIKSAAAAGHSLVVFLADLERFKNINDSLGRPAGDALLRHVAKWLTHYTGDGSLIARVGADQFAVVLPEVRQDGDVARLLESAAAMLLDHPFLLEGETFRLTAKVGVALYPQDGKDAEALLRNAEAALKRAKAGGDRFLFYTQTMTEAVAGKLILENQLRHAIDREEFVLHYQPKVSFTSGKLAGVEALIRWNDPRTGLVPPGHFIPVLEETGLIQEAGRWALRKGIETYLRWRAAGLPAVRIAVNVSALQLRSPTFIAEIEQVVALDANAAAGLELEITESLIMADVGHSISILQTIRAMGVTIAIDDFGTGFSSLSYLAKLPVDTLKIDRSFVIDMTLSSQGLALVSTIITLAHSLKLKVVAEGVETEEQSRLLRLLGCDEMQGFLFSKPLPVELFEERFLTPGFTGAV